MAMDYLTLKSFKRRRWTLAVTTFIVHLNHSFYMTLMTSLNTDISHFFCFDTLVVFNGAGKGTGWEKGEAEIIHTAIKMNSTLRQEIISKLTKVCSTDSHKSPSSLVAFTGRAADISKGSCSYPEARGLTSCSVRVVYSCSIVTCLLSIWFPQPSWPCITINLKSQLFFVIISVAPVINWWRKGH